MTWDLQATKLVTEIAMYIDIKMRRRLRQMKHPDLSAMTTSCDLEIGITSGFLHGYDFTDRQQMKDFLEINARFIGHAMVLVGLFTELQY